MNGQRDIQDATRVEFLFALDDASDLDLEVTDWESEFLGSFFKRPDCRTASFSEKQRAAIDGMIKRYLHRLPMPNGAHGVTRPTLPPDAKGRCGYLVSAAAGVAQSRCGKPAGRVNSLGLELCPEHQVLREEAIRKARDRKARRVN